MIHTFEKERVCELFCGAGGMALGFASLFEISFAVDIMPVAVRTYQANHPETRVQEQDVHDVSGTRGDFEGIIGIIGGPPCQCWSRMNLKKNANDARARLPREFLRLVQEVKPGFFVLENVPYTPKEEKMRVIKRGTALGYRVLSLHLNAAEYGAAQSRRRWIVIGYKGRRWQGLTPQQPRTVRDAFKDITTQWGVMQSGPETLERLKNTQPSQWIALSGGGFKNAIKLQWDQPSPAVVNLKKVYMVHPAENRNISLAEAAALQGFPGTYTWKGSEKGIAQMIANAMPAELARTIAQSLTAGVQA